MSLFLEKRTIAALGIVLLSASLRVTPVQAADRFYEDLLRSGVATAESGDPERAIELLRVACFGLLEEPTVLAGCLVQLALAQADMDDALAFRATFDRVVRIEDDFSGYSDAKLPTLVRKRFENRLQEWMKPEDLTRSSTFRRLAAPEELPDDQPLDEAEAANTTDEDLVAESMDPSSPKSAVSVEVTEALAAARDMQQDGGREDFTRGLERLRLLAEQYPETTDLHHMAGVLAYRLGLWRESRDFFERGGEIDSREAAMLFYFAVVLYKTDEIDKAAEVLERSLPTLGRSPFVDEYVEKILGPDR